MVPVDGQRGLPHRAAACRSENLIDAGFKALTLRIDRWVRLEHQARPSIQATFTRIIAEAHGSAHGQQRIELRHILGVHAGCGRA